MIIITYTKDTQESKVWKCQTLAIHSSKFEILNKQKKTTKTIGSSINFDKIVMYCMVYNMLN